MNGGSKLGMGGKRVVAVLIKRSPACGGRTGGWRTGGGFSCSVSRSRITHIILSRLHLTVIKWTEVSGWRGDDGGVCARRWRPLKSSRFYFPRWIRLFAVWWLCNVVSVEWEVINGCGVFVLATWCLLWNRFEVVTSGRNCDNSVSKPWVNRRGIFSLSAFKYFNFILYQYFFKRLRGLH